MARYRLKSRTFINGSLHDAGEVVEYDGKPGSTLEPENSAPAAAAPAVMAEPLIDPKEWKPAAKPSKS